MPRPKLSPDRIRAIQDAPLAERHEAVAQRVGASLPTVRKYRAEARRERQEAARQVIAQHVQETVPGALQDLNDLRSLARENYAAAGHDPRQGQLWLAAIRTTLEHVTPDDAELDATIERELARLAGRGEAAAAGPAADPE